MFLYFQFYQNTPYSDSQSCVTHKWYKILLVTLKMHQCPYHTQRLAKVSTGERTGGPLPRANFHVYRDNVSPLRGKKTHFWASENNNTSTAALRAGLPVKIAKFLYPICLRQTLNCSVMYVFTLVQSRTHVDTVQNVLYPTPAWG